MGNLMAFLSCHAGNWNFLRNKFFISGLKSNHHVSLKCLRQCSIKTDFWCQFVTCHQLTPGEKNLRNGFSCPSCLLQPNIRAKLVYANLRMNSTGLPNYNEYLIFTEKRRGCVVHVKRSFRVLMRDEIIDARGMFGTI